MISYLSLALLFVYLANPMSYNISEYANKFLEFQFRSFSGRKSVYNFLDDTFSGYSIVIFFPVFIGIVSVSTPS